MRIAPGRSLPTSHAANWYGRRSSTRASARIPHPPTHRAREPQWWRCCAGSPSCVVDCAQFAACRLRLLRLRHTGMPRRPRPPIGPSPRHPIRDVSSGSTEGFKVLEYYYYYEQAGARSAWRYSGGSRGRGQQQSGSVALRNSTTLPLTLPQVTLTARWQEVRGGGARSTSRGGHRSVHSESSRESQSGAGFMQGVKVYRNANCMVLGCTTHSRAPAT